MKTALGAAVGLDDGDGCAAGVVVGSVVGVGGAEAAVGGGANVGVGGAGVNVGAGSVAVAPVETGADGTAVVVGWTAVQAAVSRATRTRPSPRMPFVTSGRRGSLDGLLLGAATDARPPFRCSPTARVARPAVRTKRETGPDSAGRKMRDQLGATRPNRSWHANRRGRSAVLAAYPTTPEITQHEQHDEDDDDDDDDGLSTHQRLPMDVRTLCGPGGAAS